LSAFAPCSPLRLQQLHRLWETAVFRLPVASEELAWLRFGQVAAGSELAAQRAEQRLVVHGGFDAHLEPFTSIGRWSNAHQPNCSGWLEAAAKHRAGVRRRTRAARRATAPPWRAAGPGPAALATGVTRRRHGAALASAVLRSSTRVNPSWSRPPGPVRLECRPTCCLPRLHRGPWGRRPSCHRPPGLVRLECRPTCCLRGGLWGCGLSCHRPPGW